MVARLFPLTSPLGETVRVGQHYYRVIGVLEPRGRTAQSGAGTGAEAGKGAAVGPDVHSAEHGDEALWGGADETADGRH